MSNVLIEGRKVLRSWKNKTVWSKNVAVDVSGHVVSRKAFIVRAVEEMTLYESPSVV